MRPPADSGAVDQEHELRRQVTDLQAQVAALQGELARAEELAALGTVGAMVAHEVNNLMTPIITYAQMAQNYPLDSALVNKALERSVAGAQHAAKTAESILTLARPTLPSGPQRSMVRQVVQEACLLVPRGTPPLPHIECEGPVTTMAAIRSADLRQILVNLLLNACRAAGRDGQVRVRWEEATEVAIRVEDNGPGVPHDLRPLLFKPFAARSGYGTGLGLAVCERLARRAGGSVELVESGGVGAAFVVRVPVVK